MKKVLFFRFNGSNYLFYSVDGLIKLSRVKNSKFLSVLSSDKKILHEFVEILSDKKFNREFLINNKITILNHRDVDFNGGGKFIELVFTGYKRRSFLRNCSRFYSKKNILIPIYTALAGCLVIAVYAFNLSVADSNVKVSSNKDSLSNYLVTDAKKYDYRVIRVSSSNMTNFRDSYINFYNIFGKYRSKSKGEVNSYKFNNFDMDVSVNRDYYSDFDYSQDFVDNSFISLDDVFLRYDIDDQMDLFYNCLLNSDKHVNKDSLDSDIIDNYVFDYYSDKIIPKSEGSNRFIFFIGDKYGYAFITDDSINIVLKDDDDQFNIKFYNFSKKLSDKNIIEFIYSLKTK